MGPETQTHREEQGGAATAADDRKFAGDGLRQLRYRGSYETKLGKKERHGEDTKVHTGVRRPARKSHDKEKRTAAERFDGDQCFGALEDQRRKG